MTNEYAPGDKVRVPLGARVYDATVMDVGHTERLRVEIEIPGSLERVRSSYAPEEILERN